MATEILERGKTPDGRGIRLQKRGKGYDVIVVDPAGINWVYVEKQVSLEKAKNRFDLETMQYKTNPTKRKFSPAQIAAQKLFAERARAGTLGQRKKRKPNPGLYENINAKRKRIAAGSGEKMRKPGQAGRPTAEAFEQSAMTAKRNPITETLIYGLAPGETRDYMEELMYAGGQKLTQAQIDKVFKAASDAGYHSFRVAGFDPTMKPDFAAAVRRKRNPDKSKPRAYVKRASQITGAPPSKRLQTRRKMALKAPAGYFPNPSTNRGLAIFLDAVALGETYSESKLIEALDHPSLSVSDRNVIREALKGLPFNHIKLQDAAMKIRNYMGGRKTNPVAPMMTAYQVICMHPKKHVVGIFKTMAEAKMVARAMADAKNVPYAVKTVKVHKTHFAV